MSGRSIRCAVTCAALLLATVLLLGHGVGRAAVLERKTPVPAAFFGLIIHRADSGTPWPAVDFGSWMLWDSYLKWSDLEPTEGDWRLDRFDKQVQLGTTHGVELVYTLGQTPAWASTQPTQRFAYGAGTGAMPRDVTQFGRYVGKIAARYKGRIAAYQVWNEPKLGVPGSCGGVVFFCGSPDDLAQLTKVAREQLQRYDPDALLLTPAFTGGKGGIAMLDRYLATGAGRWVDAVGFHFYESRPEDMLITLNLLRDLLARHGLGHLPIWNTEVGYLVQAGDSSVVPEHDAGVFSKVWSAQQAGALLARVLLLQAAGGVDRVHWYAWDNKRMGLMQPGNGQPNAAGVAFGVVRRWLVGATVRCAAERADLWTCQLARGGRQASVTWRTDGGSLPPWTRAGQVEALNGERLNVGAGEAVAQPVQGPLLFVADGKRW